MLGAIWVFLLPTPIGSIEFIGCSVETSRRDSPIKAEIHQSDGRNQEKGF